MRLKNYDQMSDGQEIPLRLIHFLAADDDRLAQVVALTGLGRDDFATRALDPQFQAFILDYALENEGLLLEFAASEELKPEWVLAARRKLPGATF